MRWVLWSGIVVAACARSSPMLDPAPGDGAAGARSGTSRPVGVGGSGTIPSSRSGSRWDKLRTTLRSAGPRRLAQGGQPDDDDGIIDPEDGGVMDPDEEWTIPEGGASGLGRSCQEKPLAACVTSCSSRERYPLERDASGELRCPTHAPIVADTCAINCEEIYGRSAWDIDNCWFCEAGSYCVERDDHLLVPTDACAPVPSDCDSSDTQPVCGQDGEHYENKCAMNRARVDSATYRECRDDIEGYYRCGNVYCREGLEYCSVDHSVDDYSTDGFACVMSDCVAAGGCECMGFTAAGAAGAGGGAGGDWIPDNGSEQSCIEEPRRLFIVDG